MIALQENVKKQTETIEEQTVAIKLLAKECRHDVSVMRSQFLDEIREGMVFKREE